MKIITNELYGKDKIELQPSKKIVSDYTQWTYDIAPIIPTAKSAWDFQANQLAYLEQLVKDAAITIRAQRKALEDLKVMYEQLVADNYNQEIELRNIKNVE
jgi:hypothetical protein